MMRSAAGAVASAADHVSAAAHAREYVKDHRAGMIEDLMTGGWMKEDRMKEDRMTDVPGIGDEHPPDVSLAAEVSLNLNPSFVEPHKSI